MKSFQLIHRVPFRACLFLSCLTVGVGSIGNLRAEDPDVARAKAQAHAEYEAKKAAEKRQGIALTKQGLVSVYNANTGEIKFKVRWLQWDGSYTNWSSQVLGGKRSLLFSLPGGIRLQTSFSSSGGGEKTYALDSGQIPSDIKANYDDARPYKFVWTTNTILDLTQGKPKGW